MPNGKNIFDLSQIKMHLNEYISKIKDTLTSPADIEDYADCTPQKDDTKSRYVE